MALILVCTSTRSRLTTHWPHPPSVQHPAHAPSTIAIPKQWERRGAEPDVCAITKYARTRDAPLTSQKKRVSYIQLFNRLIEYMSDQYEFSSSSKSDALQCDCAGRAGSGQPTS